MSLEINTNNDKRLIHLFNKEIPIRKYGCGKNNNERFYIKKPRVNLFIQITNKCNANCSFCEYHSNENKEFNIDKLNVILKEIINKDYHIGKINFTGGEPTLDLKLFDTVISLVEKVIKENLNYKPEITLNTNGIHLLDMLKYDTFLDSIGLSRHHYDNKRNQLIFGTTNIATMEDIKTFQIMTHNPKLIQLRCNLIPNEIDNYQQIVNYLNHAIDMDCCDCGFVTLMPLNDYCKKNQVDFEKLIEKSNDIMNVVSWKRYDDNNENIELCKCSNYIYQNNEGRFCKFYRRNFCHCDLIDGQFTYDGEFLRLGFGGKIIY